MSSHDKPTSLNRLYVFNLQQVLIGRLTISTSNPDAYEFRYAKSYLESDDAQAINPLFLPLSSKVYFSKQGMNGALVAFKDAMPGIWGTATLNALANRKLSDFELLLENQQDRLGHLVFGRNRSFPDIRDSRIKEPFDWPQILNAKEQFEKHHVFASEFTEIFKQGASQGGARPKLTVQKEGDLYLAKLPALYDYENKAQIEHGTLKLAKACGLRVATSEFLSIKGHGDIFFSKRFDLVDTEKLPYLSMQSLLGVESSFEASYGDFALALKRLNGGIDSHEIYKRMLFNALISNHDDHYQNHAIYFKNGRWRLTPAFDLVAGEGNRRTLCVAAGRQGVSKSIENLLSDADKFDLTTEQAKAMFVKMAKWIALNWQAVFLEAGIEQSVIDSIKWAILHDYPDFKHD